MNLMTSILGLLLALGILVTIHEYGHFWVARRFGIKVLRFSIGFGQPLVRWHDRHGTEFVIAWIPLGGYVKMLDRREGDVSASERDQDFMSKTPSQRIAVAAAGPLANFLFAVLAFGLLYSLGVRTLVPIVEEPLANTAAHVAGFDRGDLILAVDGRSIDSWRDLSIALAKRVGDTGAITFDVLREGRQIAPVIEVERWLSQESSPELLNSLGLEPMRPEIPAVIGQVLANEAAEQAGLQVGDRIVAVNGQVIQNWLEWVTVIRANANQLLSIEVWRDNGALTLNLRPRVNFNGEEAVGYIGVGAAPFAWPEEQLIVQRALPWQALWLGVSDTWGLLQLSVSMIGKMLTGAVSVQQIGGPIAMAQMAGESVQSGLESFIGYLAFISISLGFINLLPIPVLDGGHILLYSIEAIRGRALSERFQAIITQLGLVLILALMVFAFVNDIGRLIS